MNAPRIKRAEINGWVVLDKPIGLTSTRAVAQLKHIFNGKKAGHAGTLDPLATGILPIAFGEATKTVPYVQDGEKTYRFTVNWGVETNTDDSEGTMVQESAHRPSRDDVLAQLPNFIGNVLQKPPAFSAIKINGERAYDLARDGQAPDIEPRPVIIHALDLLETTDDQAIFEARCGKGTYVRAIARDLGRLLNCFGHVTALRRTRVGPFYENDAVKIEQLMEGLPLSQSLRSVDSALLEMPKVIVDRSLAARLRRGRSIFLRGSDAPSEGPAFASCGGVLIAVGAIENGELVPARIFNLPF